MTFLEPFSLRHPKILNKNVLSNLHNNKQLMNSYNSLYIFKEHIIDLLTPILNDEQFNTIALDVALSYLDYKEILNYTEKLLYAEHYFYRAFAFYFLERENKIQSLKLQFMSRFEKSLDKPRNALILALIDLLVDSSNPDELKIKIEEIEMLIEHNEEEEDIKQQYYTILFRYLVCHFMLKRNKIENVEKSAKEILNYALSNKDPFLRARGLIFLALEKILIGEFKTAKRFIDSAIIPIEQTGSKIDKDKLLYNLMLLDLARMDYTKALERSIKRNNLGVLNEKESIINNMLTIELQILVMEEYDKEEKEKINHKIEQSLKQIIERIDQQNYPDFVDHYLLSVLVYISLGNLSKAEEELNKYIRYANEKKMDIELAKTNYYKGLIAFAKQDYLTAKKLFDESSLEASSLNMIEIEIKSIIKMIESVIYVMLNDKTVLKDSEELSKLENKVQRLKDISEKQFIPKLSCDAEIINATIHILYQGGKNEIVEESLAAAKKQALKFKYRDKIDKLNKLEKINNKINGDIKEEKEVSEDLPTITTMLLDLTKPYLGFKFVKIVKMD